MREVNLLPFIFVVFLTGEKSILLCNASCEDDRLVRFLAGIQVLSPESIFSLAIEELDNLCSKLEEGLKGIERSYQICKTQNPQGLYVLLVAGVQALNNKICCIESGFLLQFEVYHPCLYELRQDFDTCNGPADWIEETELEKVCKTYKTIVDCYYIKAAKVCGKKAALTITSLIIAVIENVVGRYSCKHIDKFPNVKDVMPAKYIQGDSSSQVPMPSIMVMISIIIYNII